MDVTYAAELVEGAVIGVFATMLGTELGTGEAIVDPAPLPEADVTSLIGLGGALRGYIALQCDSEQARDFTARLLGMDVSEVQSQDDVRDAVGELVNMIAGNVKAALAAECDAPVEIALPTVVMTPKADVRMSAALAVAVPFEDHTGGFRVELVVSER